MDYANPMVWAGLALVCTVSALAAIWVSDRFFSGSARSTHRPALHRDDLVFLLQNDTVVDHNLPRDHLDEDLETWSALREWLGPRFVDLPRSLEPSDGQAVQKIYASTAGDDGELRIETQADRTRVSLIEGDRFTPAGQHELLQSKRKSDHLDQLLRASPFPAWETTDQGHVSWSNAAAEDLERRIGKPLSQAMTPLDLAPGDVRTARVHLKVGDHDDGHWFEVTSDATRTGVIHHANDITEVVNAEKARRNFVQTLTKTFASLTIGLAVFDRNRQLALFNPALIDLTSLPADFLSARPDMMGFFDALRDRKMMPEPKDFASFRTRINDMVSKAKDGFYEETWPLPSDLTYRVAGRPHPDGAVAFLFEDISAEISLARRFRLQLDLRQSTLDQLDTAIAVVRGDHILAFCNTAFSRMWGIDPDSSFADITVHDLRRVCESVHQDPAFWTRVEDALTSRSAGPLQTDDTFLINGDHVRCQVLPLALGASMIEFARIVQTARQPSEYVDG